MEKLDKKELTGYGQLDKMTLNKEYFQKEGKSLKLGKLIKIRPFKNSIGGNIIGSFANMLSDTLRNDLNGYMAEYEKGFMIIESDGEYIDLMIIDK